MDALFGPHAGFVTAAYLGTLIAVGGLALFIQRDYRAQAARLAAMEEKGMTRQAARDAARPRAEPS